MGKIGNELKRLIHLLDITSQKSVSKLERDIILQYKTALNNIKAELATIYEKNYAGQRLQEMINKIENILKQSGTRGITITSEGLKQSYIANYKGTIGAFSKALNVGANITSTINTAAVNASVVNNYTQINWTIKSVSNINKATEIVRNSITQGIITGKPYEYSANLISNELNILTSHSMRIVRTETHRVINEARLVALDDATTAAKELGYKPVKIWMATGINSRDQHIMMDGVEADDDGIFTLPDGTQTEAPGLTGVPEHDVNCRCDIIFDIKEI